MQINRASAIPRTPGSRATLQRLMNNKMQKKANTGIISIGRIHLSQLRPFSSVTLQEYRSNQHHILTIYQSLVVNIFFNDETLLKSWACNRESNILNVLSHTCTQSVLQIRVCNTLLSSLNRPGIEGQMVVQRENPCTKIGTRSTSSLYTNSPFAVSFR